MEYITEEKRTTRKDLKRKKLFNIYKKYGVNRTITSDGNRYNNRN